MRKDKGHCQHGCEGLRELYYGECYECLAIRSEDRYW